MRTRMLGRWRIYPKNAALTMLAALSICVLSGCGGSGGTTHSISTSTTTTTTSTSTTTTAPATSAPTAQADFSVDLGAGYMGSGSIEIFAPQKSSSFVLGSSALEAGCGFNPQTDEIVPFEVTFKNTTPSFTMTATSEVESGYIDPSSNVATYSMAPVISSGDGSWTCPSGQGNSIDWANLASGSSMTVLGYLWFPNYYSPSSPSGSESTLQKSELELSFVSDSTQVTINTPMQINVTSTSTCSSSQESFISGESQVLSCPA